MSDNELQVKEVPAVEYLGDAKDPRSLHNILPRRLLNAAMTIEQEHLEFTDAELIHRMPNTCKTDIRKLRESIWIACHHAASTGKKVTEAACYYGVMSPSVWHKHLQHPIRVAYILRPPSSYEVAMKEALTFSVGQIRHILEQDHMNPKTGLLDPKIADVKRRLFENLADRVKGMPVQRTENLNVNKEIGVEQSFNDVLPSNAEDIDKKIKALEMDMEASARDVTNDKE